MRGMLGRELGISSIRSAFLTSQASGVESRVRQLEQLIGRMQTQQAAPHHAQTAQPIKQSSFKAVLNEQVTQARPGATTVSQVSPAQAGQVVGLQSQGLVNRRSSLDQSIQAVGRQYQVSPKLISALIQQESGFNPNATSKAGAQGLMQLMPSTARAMGVTNPMDPQQNLQGGVKYLKQQLEQFNGNIPLALAAYNAGPGAVKQHGGIPPYPETKQYVQKILKRYLSAQ